jgi:hypothetical protein
MKMDLLTSLMLKIIKHEKQICYLHEHFIKRKFKYYSRKHEMLCFLYDLSPKYLIESICL